ncbi:MAG: response regulator [Spirochaetales bacterium]|nr:response regulator [Spirochaetales bacterium]
MVLIIDDQPANIDILLEILGEEADAAVALSGEEALEILEEETPSLILLDVVMPGMDGFELCRRVKERDSWKGIPVVFLSAGRSDEDLARAEELGAVGFLAKPVNPGEVLDALRKYSS